MRYSVGEIRELACHIIPITYSIGILVTSTLIAGPMERATPGAAVVVMAWFRFRPPPGAAPSVDRADRVLPSMSPGTNFLGLATQLNTPHQQVQIIHQLCVAAKLQHESQHSLTPEIFQLGWDAFVDSRGRFDDGRSDSHHITMTTITNSDIRVAETPIQVCFRCLPATLNGIHHY